MKPRVVITETGKLCTRCARDLPIGEYYPARTGTLGLRSECKECWSLRIKRHYIANRERVNAKNKAWRDANPEKAAAIHRRSRLRRKFGISVEEYDAMLFDQRGRCAGCGSTDNGDRRFDTFAVDHHHQTGKVRGLLCSPCNLALGHVNDSPDRLMALAAYLLQQTDLLSDHSVEVST